MNSIILKKPVITEKSIDKTKEKWFTFEVSPTARKTQIRKEVEKLFSVTVTDIKTYVRKGKTRRTGRLRKETQTKTRKYARVKLLPEQTIELFTVAVD